MAVTCEHAIWQRLQRVQALHDGATTPGERAAAAEAKKRLMQRLHAVRKADPVARFVEGHVRTLGISRPPEPPAVELPTRRQVSAMLAAWEEGSCTDARIRDWAARLVGAVDLPSHPDAVGACRAEVLLQLAMLERVPLSPRDVPAVRRFLRTRDWGEWFALVARASALAS